MRGFALIILLPLIFTLFFVFFLFDTQPSPDNDSLPLWVYLPSGWFVMGSAASPWENNTPVHLVILNGFYMTAREITAGQLARVLKRPPRRSSSLPAAGVDIKTAQQACRALGGRLPTEAEWEYAARGRLAAADFPWGDDPPEGRANVASTGLVPSGRYPPNAFGLYDMCGNVAEWCSDWFSASSYANSPLYNPAGPASGKDRVLRGGAYTHHVDSLGPAYSELNLAFRERYDPADPVPPYAGFRCVKNSPMPRRSKSASPPLALNLQPPEPTVIDSVLRYNFPVLNLPDRLNLAVRAFLGTVYKADPLGEGSQGEIDKDPLWDFSGVDCVTYVEQALALALTDCWKNFLPFLNRIRYHQGVVAFQSRNHYMCSDWVPHNAWLVNDLTTSLALPSELVTETRLLAKKAFFAKVQLKKNDQPFTDSYLKASALKKILPRLRACDIILFIGRRSDIFVQHLGFFFPENSRPLLWHASLTEKKVAAVDLHSYLKSHPAFIGLKILRLRALS